MARWSRRWTSISTTRWRESTIWSWTIRSACWISRFAQRRRQHDMFVAHLLGAIAQIQPQVEDARHLVQHIRQHLRQLAVPGSQGNRDMEADVMLEELQVGKPVFELVGEGGFFLDLS